LSFQPKKPDNTKKLEKPEWLEKSSKPNKLKVRKSGGGCRIYDAGIDGGCRFP
jgi:hypothetical protein